MATYKISYATLYPRTSTSSLSHTHRHSHQKVTTTPAPNVSTPFQNYTQTPPPTIENTGSYYVSVTPQPTMEKTGSYYDSMPPPTMENTGSYIPNSAPNMKNTGSYNHSPTPKPNVLSKSQDDIFANNFWIYKEPWNYFQFVSKVLGKPDEINTCAGGFITWYNSPSDKLFGMRNVFSKHILRDQRIVVECPKPQVDFFYSYLKYTLNYDKISDVLTISSGISYDSVAGELCVRSSNLGQNIILTLLAVQINNGSLNIRNIHANGIISKFFKDSEKPTAIIHHYRTLSSIIPEVKTPITNESIQNKRRYKHNPFPIMFKE